MKAVRPLTARLSRRATRHTSSPALSCEARRPTIAQSFGVNMSIDATTIARLRDAPREGLSPREKTLQTLIRSALNLPPLPDASRNENKASYVATSPPVTVNAYRERVHAPKTQEPSIRLSRVACELPAAMFARPQPSAVKLKLREPRSNAFAPVATAPRPSHPAPKLVDTSEAVQAYLAKGGTITTVASRGHNARETIENQIRLAYALLTGEAPPSKGERVPHMTRNEAIRAAYADLMRDA